MQSRVKRIKMCPGYCCVDFCILIYVFMLFHAWNLYVFKQIIAGWFYITEQGLSFHAWARQCFSPVHWWHILPAIAGIKLYGILDCTWKWGALALLLLVNIVNINEQGNLERCFSFERPFQLWGSIANFLKYHPIVRGVCFEYLVLKRPIYC